MLAKEDTSIKKISIADTPANMLTKPLPISKFKHCLNSTNIKCWDLPSMAFVEEVENYVEDWSWFCLCLQIRVKLEMYDI